MRPSPAIPAFLTALLRGLGQIMLQGNAATGLLFFAGITWGSPAMGMAALLAVSCGTGTARLLGYDKAEVAQGLYGFSAALVGVALVLFQGTGPEVWCALVAGSALATVLQHFFIRRKIPAFTLPFVVVTWAALVLLPVPAAAAAHAEPVLPGGVLSAAMVRGFGQVIFQADALSGLLFIVGVAVHSRTAAVFGLASALLAALMALALERAEADVAMGLWSFNAVLCGIALAGAKRRNILLALIAVPLAVVIGRGMEQLPLPQLTFPFVAATFTALMGERLFGTRAA